MAAKQSAPPIVADASTLFQAYVDLINSERETIWARHNALLVANSLIVGALAISPAALWQTKWAAVALLGAGLLISGVWLLITAHGWAVLHRHIEMASAFVVQNFPNLPNPFSEAVSRRSGLWIHGLALTMVCVFLLIYLGLGYVRLASA
jgi:hypothetical protein